jgi:hypothetical protein
MITCGESEHHKYRMCYIKRLIMSMCVCMFTFIPSAHAQEALNQLATCSAVVNVQIQVHTLVHNKTDIRLLRWLNMRNHIHQVILPQLSADHTEHLVSQTHTQEQLIWSAISQAHTLSRIQEVAHILRELDATCEPLNTYTHN